MALKSGGFATLASDQKDSKKRDFQFVIEDCTNDGKIPKGWSHGRTFGNGMISVYESGTLPDAGGDIEFYEKLQKIQIVHNIDLLIQLNHPKKIFQIRREGFCYCDEKSKKESESNCDCDYKRGYYVIDIFANQNHFIFTQVFQKDQLKKEIAIGSPANSS